ncbi:MAG TPA: DUF350 domain-containing protein [Longimicrobiales bacterium]|jgi:uncharacterized membrane protein YjfL (UPF0719 family)
MTDLVPNMLAALAYAVLGIVIFLASFVVMEKVSPASLWHEIIEEHNTALAVVVAGVSIGMSIVIAASIF